jgi:tungstate transport system permease protein
VSFFSDGLSQAWHLVITGDHDLLEVTWTTLKVAGYSTAIAAVVGLPLGLLLGLGRFRGRGACLALANAGLGLPPVIVGLALYLMIFPKATLGRLHLLFTLNAVYIAQTILAFPIIVALTASSVRAITPGLLDQARAFGAGRIQVGLLALREARIGILAGIIAAVGAGLSEVGAVVIVGGNIDHFDQTLASRALEDVNGGRYAPAIADGIVLLGLVIVVSALLTFFQRGEKVPLRAGRPS